MSREDNLRAIQMVAIAAIRFVDRMDRADGSEAVSMEELQEAVDVLRRVYSRDMQERVEAEVRRIMEKLRGVH